MFINKEKYQKHIWHFNYFRQNKYELCFKYICNKEFSLIDKVNCELVLKKLYLFIKECDGIQSDTQQIEIVFKNLNYKSIVLTMVKQLFLLEISPCCDNCYANQFNFKHTKIDLSIWIIIFSLNIAYEVFRVLFFF